MKTIVGKEIQSAKLKVSDALLREIFIHFGDRNGRKDY